MARKKKVLVISAVNLVEGGPLTILKDCVNSAVAHFNQDWEIIVLINREDLLDTDDVTKCIYSLPKKSWLIRLFYEWVYFYFLSRRLKPSLWLSLHDITPNVKATKKAVYCHNPSPFYHYPIKNFLMAPKLWGFNKFYKFLYAINIKKNNFVIVQQSWLREKFIEFYGQLNIVVAYPSMPAVDTLPLSKEHSKNNIFLYPAFPRVFKNFEVICRAVALLQSKSVSNFEVIFTIDGNENKYSQMLKKEYGHLKNISFIGLQNKKTMDNLYRQAKAVVFPSKLETWGLPITEAKVYNRHLLVADLPYAKETVGNYEKVTFFEPDNDEKLSQLMLNVINDEINHTGHDKKEVNPPFSESWQDFWAELIADV